MIFPAPNQSATSGRRVQTIDALRGVAAVSVALFHFNEVRVRGANFYDLANRWGWLGVTVFFVLSGYCVQLASQRETRPSDFLLRRFARVYPAYLFSVAAVVAFCAGRKLLTGTNDFIALPKSFAAWLATLTLTTAPVTGVKTVNWVYWSLSYEIFFYFILGLGLAWPRLRQPWLLALCVAALVPSIAGHIFFLRNWGPFALGVGLASMDGDRGWRAILLTVAGIAVMLVGQTAPEIAAAAVTALLIAGAPRFEVVGGWLLAGLARIGKVSYGLYLIHVPVGVWLVEGFFDRRGWRGYGLAAHLLCDAVALATSLLAAAAIFRLIERPGIAWGRRMTPATVAS